MRQAKRRTASSSSTTRTVYPPGGRGDPGSVLVEPCDRGILDAWSEYMPAVRRYPQVAERRKLPESGNEPFSSDMGHKPGSVRLGIIYHELQPIMSCTR